MTECLTDDEVNGFLTGRTAGGARDEAELHLGGCRACRRRLATAYGASRTQVVHTRAPRWLLARVLGAREGGRAPFWTALPLYRRQLVAGLAAVLAVAFGVTTFLATRSEPRDAPRVAPSDPLRHGERASAAPRLLAPANGAVVDSDRVELEWSESESATSYAVTLLDEKGDIVFETSTTARALTLSAAEARLERGRSYFWYASAKLPGGTAADSEVGRFSLDDR